jgi:hypothetical protein
MARFTRAEAFAINESMPTVDSTLLLHCDTPRSVYTLATHGAPWHRTFGSLPEAIKNAATMVEEDTPVVVYDELGRLLFTATISPTKGAKDGQLPEDWGRAPGEIG